MFGRHKRLIRGKLLLMSWNGIGLAKTIETNPVQSWISDFFISDINGDGIRELVLSVVGRPPSLLSFDKRSSNIIAYELK